MKDTELQLGFFCAGVVVERAAEWAICVDVWSKAIVDFAFSRLELSQEAGADILQAQVSRQLKDTLQIQSLCTYPLIASVAYVYCPLREEAVFQVHITAADAKLGYSLPLSISRPTSEQHWMYRLRQRVRARLGREPLPRGIRFSTMAPIERRGEVMLHMPELTGEEEDSSQQLGEEQAELLSMTAVDDIVMVFTATMFVELQRLGAIRNERFAETLKQVRAALETVPANDLSLDKLGWLAKRLSKVANEQGAVQDGE